MTNLILSPVVRDLAWAHALLADPVTLLARLLRAFVLVVLA